jgi:hypothetical protein
VVADAVASDWTAASWLVDGRDVGRLIAVAGQDAARLTQ